MSNKQVILPWDEAVDMSAKQNFDRDVRVHTSKLFDWETMKEMYFDEAEYMLRTFGQNHRPEFEDHVLIIHSDIHPNGSAKGTM